MALRDFILHNFWWKLLSLLLAGLTWLTIETALEREHKSEQSPVVGAFSRTFPALPITVLTSSTNSNRFRLSPSTVSVDVSGPADQLQKLQEREIHVYIDLSDVGDEKQLRRPIQAQVPQELKVEKLDPISTTAERITIPK